MGVVNGKHKIWAQKLGTFCAGLLLGVAGIGMTAPELTPGEVGGVKSVLDGDTLYLDDGLKVRLAAIQAPKLPLGRKGFKAWPLGEESKAALTELTKGKSLQLYYGGEKRDRYDRALAQSYTLKADGERDIWLQEAMVSRGMARVYTWPDTYQDSKRLYAAEIIARDAKRGIWGHDYYRIRSPEPNALAQDIDSYQIVQGIITSAADVRGQIYLNFGADYKTDFTIAIAKRDRNRFETAGIDLLKLEGATVRIRGWIELSNGPMIWLDHPERLEVLN
jgi:endonuclease YncB( thermonuclease family)